MYSVLSTKPLLKTHLMPYAREVAVPWPGRHLLREALVGVLDLLMSLAILFWGFLFIIVV